MTRRLTIFGTPKAFVDAHTSVIQTNAITSWTQLEESVRVLLIGDDPGVADFAQSLGIVHIPSVARNPHGTPLVGSIFELALQHSDSDILAYVNSDIILLADILPAVDLAPPNGPFLLVGLRTELNLSHILDFRDTEWQSRLIKMVKKYGWINKTLGGSDYFIFQRDTYQHIPPLALGRYVWDNWLIYGAQAYGALVVDSTHKITAIHQTHDYSHHDRGRDGIAFGEETWSDLLSAGGEACLRTLFHVKFRLSDAGCEPIEDDEKRSRLRSTSRALEREWIDKLKRIHLNG